MTYLGQREIIGREKFVPLGKATVTFQGPWSYKVMDSKHLDFLVTVV